MKTARRPGAFTLMEVLAAIAFLVIVLPVAMHGISLAVAEADVAKYKAEGAVLAQSKLNELQATREWQSGNLSGDFGEDHPEFRWTAEMVAWNATPVQQLDVHVFWRCGGQERQVTLSTLVDTEAN
jgi:type II secretory pathway pseudopilin PulG